MPLGWPLRVVFPLQNYYIINIFTAIQANRYIFSFTESRLPNTCLGSSAFKYYIRTCMSQYQTLLYRHGSGVPCQTL